MSTLASPPHLVVRGARKLYGGNIVLDGVDLAIIRGELVTLLGPSGCGKTTLLRIVAGLTAPDAGSVELAGQDITRLATHKRNVGVVFQSYALFPHLSVAGNVGFALSVRKKPRAEIDAAVKRALSLVHLEHLASRPISALSGGQQQRVALARAIAAGPDILLFDEALSALDRKLREEMQIELRRMLQELGVTAIFVTHDQDEALTMSDRIAVMNSGRIEQLADPITVYSKPASLFTLNFVGLSTRIPGTVVASRHGEVEVETKLGRLLAPATLAVGTPVIVAARPESLRVATGDTGNSISGRVRSVVFHGSRTLVELFSDDTSSLLAELPQSNTSLPEPGRDVRLSWPVDRTFAFDARELAA